MNQNDEDEIEPTYTWHALQILRDQYPSKLYAFRLVDEKRRSPYSSNKLTFVDGDSYEVKDAETNEDISCAKGLGVATFEWCLKHRKPGWKVLKVEFEVRDIAAIPKKTNGKFRLHRCKIISTVDC